MPPPPQIVWAVWVPTAGNDMRKVVLTNVPGRLVSSSRTPLTEIQEPAGARQIKAGSVEVEINGSPVFLVLEK